MPAMQLAIFALFGFFLLVATMSVVRAVRRRRKRVVGGTSHDDLTRCRCGYPLDALDSVRCPECGRVAGFDATAEELGLTEEELRLAKAKRDQRSGMG